MVGQNPHQAQRFDEERPIVLVTFLRRQFIRWTVGRADRDRVNLES